MDRFSISLSNIANDGCYRELHNISGIDFTSNDYLAFSKNSEISDSIIEAISSGVPLGSGASRLLRGNYPSHNKLEEFASGFFSSEATLYFANGYIANFAIFITLCDRNDIIIYDELSHASTRDGIYASKAKSYKFSHNNTGRLAELLIQARKNNHSNNIWVAVEGLYSMDGDIPPILNILDLVNEYDAFLIIDEAHSTGVLGNSGRGISDSIAHLPNVITVHTCGKALGSSGALLCSSALIKEYMVNKCRPFIFSTAPPPILAIAVKKALEILLSKPILPDMLKELYDFARQELLKLFPDDNLLNNSQAQILPILIGDAREAVIIANKMQHQGFDIRAIRPPTVPNGSSRLRISITLNIDKADIVNMINVLNKVING